MNSDNRIRKIAVIGAGAWGTALSIIAARAGSKVMLWARNPALSNAINQNRTNVQFLAGYNIPDEVTATSEIAEAVAISDAIILAVPSQAIRKIGKMIHNVAPTNVPIVLASKGVENKSGKLMSAIVAEEMPGQPIAVLSGPSLASEVAASHPTAVIIASADAIIDPDGSLANRLSLALATPFFRPYISDDLIGVEICGAVKNVIAIASGIASGYGFGANTCAAIITRGLYEIKSLARALGGRDETLAGLSGIGDLALTCSFEQSRNMSFGKVLSSNQHCKKDLVSSKQDTVEGVVNAVSITDLARRLGIEMPICEAVRSVISDDMEISEVINRLVQRPLKAEHRCS
ncbi:glycerol-3-phosphate dehydrogenase [NAD(P)+] [Candidatus Endolissoclinum faulkneri L5]|uniref:Glycerol-3-phosphate dehydrogenase [NAD(P)+] n=1 Tax=Candidatus Endolissoclinum faulkneri L5 TaxID=1401328 RepID=V9TSF5_9PROT|nr:NAD(P)H-dependent glycerol-3-phosphate dehydrogenase [Candidatus Endolissoclinum faulkneri]AHC73521.1 glycerol-3-phosphate dehydrogenase [NAD(P)+] [Candidatus Endolissoclinum faulkneri L5]